MSCSGPGNFKEWLRSWIKSADKVIFEAWQNSAYILLNRLFEKWEPSNQQAMKTFIHLLTRYLLCFDNASQRVFYLKELPVPFIEVSESLQLKKYIIQFC